MTLLRAGFSAAIPQRGAWGSHGVVVSLAMTSPTYGWNSIYNEGRVHLFS